MSHTPSDSRRPSPSNQQSQNSPRNHVSAEQNSQKEASNNSKLDDDPLSLSLSEIELESIDGTAMFDWRSPNATPLSLPHIKGYTDIREELARLVVDPVTADHDYYARYKVGVPDLLFTGPPGTGKTHAAEALAGELNIPYLILSPSAVNSQWVNRSGRLVQRLFAEGEVIAQETGYVFIFLDEIDAALPDREANRKMNHEGHKVVNEFLTELETTDERHIIFLGATNQPSQLDDAATRHGRINRTIRFGTPTVTGRVEILNYHLADRPHNLAKGDLWELAESHLTGMLPAHIKTVADNAARRAAYTQSDQLTFAHLKHEASTLEIDSTSTRNG